MKYFSMFSGIGGFELGIHNIRPIKLECGERPKELNCSKDELQQWKCVGYSEVDKYAIQIYERHFGDKGDMQHRERTRVPQCPRCDRDSTDSQGESRKDNNDNGKGHKNYGDCTKIKWEDVEDFDLLVGGFPCQAFSIAGKRKGFDDTRGTLFFEIARCLKEKQPRLFLLENVKGLLSHDKGQTGITILSTLDELGYDVQWQVLNSKNFGVPQNRERVFFVGHLRGTPRPEVFPFGGADQEDTRNVGEDVAYTIDANYHKGTNTLAEAMGQGGGHTPIVEAIRRLTPTECERLQGFPDGWTEGISDTQRYKCLGNAVTVNVIQAIMERLLERED